MPTRVDYFYDKETPENTGWYICHYGTVADLLANSPEDNIGPYETKNEALRVLAETTTLEDADERAEKKVKAYDPSRDPTPASIKALVASADTDDLTADEADTSEGVQLELQQAQELRDLPPEVQRD